MKLKKLLIISLGVVLLGFVGCAEEEEELVEFDILTKYMLDNDLDLPRMLDIDSDGKADWITTAEKIFTSGPDNFFIVDLRTADKKPANGTVDFEDGHIPGAHMVSLANVVEYVETNNSGDLPIVVVCYSGQSAGHAVMSLRLNGYTSAKVLKFGMSSWHADFDAWTGNCGNSAIDYSDAWDATTTVPDLPSFSEPMLSTGYEDGGDILDARIEAMLSGGFHGKSATEVLSNADAYNVLNYWAESDWAHYGHVQGACQLTPGTLSIEEGLKEVDPDNPNIVYCWTGQTASMITAFLTVLGFEAYDLKFGANGMIYDNLESHKWSSGACMNYEYVTGP